ncbi:PaaI family thioesterase [Paracoccus sp. (in: a-proteobacteria)]|uniref:PaaI family thioesterase n=1 Tax=Paracoccus sp. TaxID=267 RepID=UPI0026E0F5C6|nr:PaaI family thioesterase [Paracoccus sp. (in: a-proteobacteria)]MDO5647640.1 PaaI family thioesterase [Paracoccus sp. (in: a-proteobacteria)]
MTIIMDASALNDFLARDFPQTAGQFVVQAVNDALLTMRMPVDDRNLRPGGTVSGPSMFALADVAVYCAVLARIGPVALAVTTNASIDFMRKPTAGRDLIAECRLLKLGRLLAVGDVLIWSQGDDQPVARASMTYAIPPK